MKRQILISVLMMYVFITNAQITLTETNSCYEIGDVYQIQEVNKTGISPGSFGANQTWDFSNVTSTTSYNLNIVDATTTPETANFPNANIATLKNTTGSYRYFSARTDSLSYNGNSGSSVLSYQNPEVYFTYPFTYNDSIHDDFYAAASSFMKGGETTIKADAYGTIITPIGTFNNVLRIKTEKYSLDTSKGAFGLPDIYYHYDMVIYEWFDGFSKYPIFSIASYEEQNYGFSDTIVNYLMNPVTGNNINYSEISVNIYPNPSNGIFTINFPVKNNDKTKVTILNINGQKINDIYINDCSKNIDISEQPKGIYLLKIENGINSVYRKLIIN